MYPRQYPAVGVPVQFNAEEWMFGLAKTAHATRALNVGITDCRKGKQVVVLSDDQIAENEELQRVARNLGITVRGRWSGWMRIR
jgi:hypothetical protein